MALQTPTSTTSSSPSPTPPPRPPPPDANEQHSSLSPAGSPPLILAFLAIGLFTGAMVIVFGWRRVFGRSLTFGSLPTSTVERKPTFLLPAKPKLWDMWDAYDVTWGQVSGGVGYHNGDWTKLMVSAKYTSGAAKRRQLSARGTDRSFTGFCSPCRLEPYRSMKLSTMRRSASRPVPQLPGRRLCARICSIHAYTSAGGPGGVGRASLR